MEQTLFTECFFIHLKTLEPCKFSITKNKLMKFQNVNCAVTVPMFPFCPVIYREGTLDCSQPCAFARPMIEFRNSAATEQNLHSLSWPLQRPNLETWPH